jgi:single-stranded-DNA-specific exonuclease
MRAPPASPEAEAPGRDLSPPRKTMISMEARWELRPCDPAQVEALAREAGLPTLLARLLVARGVCSATEAGAYLRPTPDALHDSSRLLSADAAADLLVATVQRGRRVVVFGDYDVDGVTAVAQLRAALTRIGGDAAAFIPHRLRDGYGLKPATVRKVLEELRPATIVTVDCGISAVEGVACARAAGVEVIVTDHHLVPDELPAGAVVVNPKQPGCGYPYKELAATAISMKIAEAVGRRAGRSVSRESLLRAACLGTIADVVPLDGENRVIAALGLQALAASRAPGLRALLAESGLAQGAVPTAEEVAFRIAPRLNAAGRLDTAMLALSLFEERDPVRAEAIARELSARNAERQALERQVVAQARERIGDADEAAVLIDADARWHRGVLGIAASRLAREYHRPVLLFGLEGGRASGSGRSIPGVSLHGILSELVGFFSDFGGHDQAVGGSMPAERFEEFRAAAAALFARRVPKDALVRSAAADAELSLDAVDADLHRQLLRLEPHGAGNARPVFLARGVRAAAAFSRVGTSGLRGRLATSKGGVRAIAWQPDAAFAPMAAAGLPFDLQYRVSDDGRGYGLQVEIAAVRPASPEVA